MVRAGARVTHVVAPGHDCETHSRGVERVVAPFADDGEPWLEAIERLAAEDDGELVVLPMTDRGSELLALARDRLPPNVLAFERSGDAHLALMDKRDGRRDRAPRGRPGAVDAGREQPRRAGGARVAGAVAVRRQADPLARLARPLRRGARVRGARTPRRRRAASSSRCATASACCCRQYIPGDDADVEEAIVVRLADGSYPVCFGCRKLRQSPSGFGATAVGFSDPLPETTALARAVLDAAGFVGVAGVEAKRHRDTDERWFLEVNVRVPAQWGLGDACGAEASTRLVAALAGRELGQAPTPRPGVGIVVPVLDVRVMRERLHAVPARRRPLQLLRLLRPYLKARELGLLDPRDPGPGLAWLGAIARRRLGRLRRGR